MGARYKELIITGKIGDDSPSSCAPLNTRKPLCRSGAVGTGVIGCVASAASIRSELEEFAGIAGIV
jgi:hypothetical protein